MTMNRLWEFPLRLRLQLLLSGAFLAAAATGFANDSAMSVEDNAVVIFSAFTEQQSLDATDLAVTPETADSIQDFYIALLRPTWGMDVGYASLAMARSDTAELPPTGVLLENMFTGTRAVISRSFGFDMHAAAELMVRVGSPELNHATTRLEALSGLQALIPTVRLSDGYRSDAGAQAPPLARAANLYVRLCVLGRELGLRHEPAEIENLSSYSVEMLDQNQQQIVRKTSAGQPHILDAVLATVKALGSRGIEVRTGDVLALGPLTDRFPVSELTRLRAVFHDLDRDEELSVYMGFQ